MLLHSVTIAVNTLNSFKNGTCRNYKVLIFLEVFEVLKTELFKIKQFDNFFLFFG